MKILLIEDDKSTVEVIRLTLEVHDPESNIVSREKGKDGLETAKNETFDVIVLDLGLPDIDGMQENAVKYFDGRITNNLTICSETQEIIVKGTKVDLTTDEWNILKILIEHRGKIVSSKTLSEIISNRNISGEIAVTTIINQLRNKLEDDPYLPRMIISEYECGYRFIRTEAS